MTDGKNHSIIHTPADFAGYGDAIKITCDPPEEAHKTWVKEQGVCTNQGPQVQLSMMLHSLRKEASALLCEAVQAFKVVFSVAVDFLVHIICFLHIQHILHITNTILHCLQLELMMAKRVTTGRLLITGQVFLFPSEPIAGSKETRIQILKSKAVVMLVFESTFGTEPRFAVF